jgi:hypothetical protein
MVSDNYVTRSAAEYVTMLGASTPQDVACAEEVKGPIVAAGACTLGTVGLGLFGVYKLFNGKPAAGITGLVASVVTLGVGRVLASAAAVKFEQCRGIKNPTFPFGPAAQVSPHTP